MWFPCCLVEEEVRVKSFGFHAAWKPGRFEFSNRVHLEQRLQKLRRDTNTYNDSGNADNEEHRDDEVPGSYDAFQ